MRSCRRATASSNRPARARLLTARSCKPASYTVASEATGIVPDTACCRSNLGGKFALREQDLHHLRIAERAKRPQIDTLQHDLLRHHAGIVRGLHLDQRIARCVIEAEMQVGGDITGVVSD